MAIGHTLLIGEDEACAAALFPDNVEPKDEPLY